MSKTTSKTSSRKPTSSSVAIPAKRIPVRVSDQTVLRRRWARISSVSLDSFALLLFCERIRVRYAKMRRGLGGECDWSLRKLVMASCPSDYDPVALAVGIDGIGCTCSDAGKGLMPSPSKRDYKGSNLTRQADRLKDTMNDFLIYLFATPTKLCQNGYSEKNKQRKLEAGFGLKLTDQLAGQPHPEFLEALMGFETGWTELKH